MIVTDTTLVGFTMISGTWGVQLALFIASMFNFFVSPDPDVIQDSSVTDSQYQTEMADLRTIRAFWLPISHGLLTIMTFIGSSDRIPWDGIKQANSFLALMIYVMMIL